MKKITLILFSLLIFFLVSCDNEPPKEPGNLYNIKYEKNGGEFILSPFTKARKGTYISIPEIRKTGYILESWKGAEQASDGSWGFTMKEYDVSLKAIWNASNYPITYDLNGGEWVTTPPEDTAQTDSDVYLDEKPKLAGFHFVKWTSDDVKLDLTKFGYHFKMPSHSVSLKAEYSADRYGISYVLDGGDFAEQWYPESAYKDEEVFIVASPEKAGYVFAGWESGDVEIKKDDDIYSFIMPHKNIELKAKWEANLIELKWFEIGDISVVRQAYTDQVITLPTGLTKDNYDFVGWRVVPNTVSEAGKFTVRQIDEKNKYMTIEALWEGKKYNINYDIGEGAVWKEPPKTEGKLFSDVIIPELNKEGAVVTGWTSSDPNDDIQKLPSEDVNAYRLFRVSGDDITLTPIYEVEINYDLVHNNAKIIEDYDTTAIQYSVIRLPRCECEGYRFLGWKYKSTEIPIAEIDGKWHIAVGSERVSVEAVWQKVNTIKFYDGDNLLATFEVEDGDNIEMPYPDPSRWPEGSKFMLWYNMDAGKGNYIEAFKNYIPSTSVSFKAVWGYPIGGALMYDDPEARDENIVYSFFNYRGTCTWQNYEPGMIHTPGFSPDYYSVELKNGATITKDRFYVYRPGWERTDATWTYSVDGKFQFPITGANKTEIGGGRYNTQLVLGLIKEGEEAKRGIANINTSSPYTQPDPQGKGANYTIWSCLHVLNKNHECNDWYIPSPEEARLIKEYQGSSTPIWTSAEARIQPQNSAFIARFDTDVKKSYIDSWSKVSFGHYRVMIDYMRSF